jgi:hypothetical protein
MDFSDLLLLFVFVVSFSLAGTHHTLHCLLLFLSISTIVV